jgi:hypothetical protein
MVSVDHYICQTPQYSLRVTIETYRWSTELVSQSLIGEVHIGAKALQDIYFIFFGYITRLSHWGGREYLLVHMTATCLRGTYVEEGEGGDSTL